MSVCDVTIIGAGPYGLAAAAHLRQVKGLDCRAFGDPMSFWKQNMPVGMFLRSNWTATQIADPEGSLTLESFQADSGHRFSTPVPLDAFVGYGQWYQKAAVPDLDRRKVVRVAQESGGFQLTLSDGEIIHSRRIIVAAGIGSFTFRPPEFHDLPPALVTHTSEHSDLAKFGGKSVLVVGSGQSALESGALLHEGGAQVEIVGRSHRVHWLQGKLSRTLHRRLGKAISTVLYAPTDVGPAGISQLVARPDILCRLPRGVQDRLRRRATRPAGARWLVERLRAVPLRLGISVVSAAPRGQRVTIALSDGSTRSVDHVLLGTGYRVDVAKLEFLERVLAQSVLCTNGYPRLKVGFESSVAGLHFIGAPAAWSFGPLMQFVSGARYTSRALVRYIAGNDLAS